MLMNEIDVPYSAVQHRHLIFQNGCPHSEHVLRPIFTVITVLNTGETGDINNKPVANVTKKKEKK